ncbi:MAG: hypothetical protein AAGE43_16845 [Pseudomonadota bacterium]
MPSSLPDRTGVKLRLLAVLVVLGGCSGKPPCEEWTTHEVVDYNFCNGNRAADEVGAVQMPGDQRCVAPGTRARIVCVEPPPLD